MRGSCFLITNQVFIPSAAALEAFATIAHQLLQDVQERLVFRAHLYLQSDIQNYNPSTGDLAYPEKLEMMEVCAEIANLMLPYIFHSLHTEHCIVPAGTHSITPHGIACICDVQRGRECRHSLQG